ncbi:hypothetical protein MBT84_29715 [Streptomyces sp. MBT84]|nr:hypothetical protein [Streptomyces sp. MBT84]
MIPKLVPVAADSRRAARAGRCARRPAAPMFVDSVRNPMSAAESPRTLMYLGAPGAAAALPVRGAETAGRPEPAPSTAARPVPPVRLAPPDRSPSSSTPGFRKA